jgi:hypothetical protein
MKSIKLNTKRTNNPTNKQAINLKIVSKKKYKWWREDSKMAAGGRKQKAGLLK